MRDMQRTFALLIVAAILVPWTGVYAQVTTATLYGIVRDSTAAVLPGATVAATNEGTNLSREVVTDERGEFAMPALPTGTYSLKIALPGFKTSTNQGLALGAGQTLRQTFVLEIGQVSENITVAASAPLVETVSVTQVEALALGQVTELPVARRNTGASAVTVTDSLISPTINSKSSLIVSPVSMRTPSRRAVRNPASSTTMR